MDRSPPQFDNAALHITYELTQLVEAARYLDLHPEGGFLANACLESMLVHVRSLIDFTLFNRRHPSDLHRNDFVGAWSPPSSEASTRLLKDAPIVINKHLAHLTWQRVDQGKQAWDYPDIAGDVLHVFGEFVAEATTQNAPACQILGAALTRAREEHRPIVTPVGVRSLSSTTNSSGQVDVVSYGPSGTRGIVN